MISRRDFFAAISLHAMASNSDVIRGLQNKKNAGKTVPEVLAPIAVEYADILIAALDKPTPSPSTK